MPSDYAPTSAEAYAHIIANDLIRRNRQAVYTYIHNNQDDPSFNGGIARYDVNRQFNDESDSYCPRIHELIDHGVIERRGRKINPATGCSVYYHRLTCRQQPLPLPTPPKAYYVAHGDPPIIFPRRYRTLTEAQMNGRIVMRTMGWSAVNMRVIIIRHNWELCVEPLLTRTQITQG